VEEKSRRRPGVVSLPLLLPGRIFEFIYGGEFLLKLSLCYHSLARSLSVLEWLLLS
jgi:hypothetical protein